MNVYIVRDAVELGQFPREDMERLARSGELKPEDFYWHEGMEDWRPLPELLGADIWKREEPTAKSPRIGEWFSSHRSFVLGAISGAAFVAVVWLLTMSLGGKETTASATSSPPPAHEDLALRERATAELKRKIDNLPARATPPLNVFYYDVAVEVAPARSPYAQFTATIRGSENTVDESDTTTRRTTFTLTADYRAADWIYQRYDAIEADLATGTTTEIHDDAEAPIPPRLVGILGLTRRVR